MTFPAIMNQLVVKYGQPRMGATAVVILAAGCVLTVSRRGAAWVMLPVVTKK